MIVTGDYLTTDRIVKKGRAEEPTGVDSPPPSTPTTPTPVRYVSGKILDSPTTSSRLGQRPYGTPAGPACDGWLECRKKVASGVSALIDDVHHLVSARPFGHKLNSAALPTARPRLFEEILQLRLMADELQAAFYPQTLPTTADTITKTSTPLPAAPVEAATTKPTYSSAAKAAIPPPAMGSPATKPPTKKPPQKPRLPDKAPPPPTTSRSAPQRLILRFANSSVIKSVSDPQRLRDSLNDALKGASRLRGVNLSRGGNLVLHTQAPYTAVQLREHEQTIWGVVRPYFTLGERDRPRFHLDKPWQRVVVHRVPVTTSSTSRSLVEELRWSNDGIGALADVMGVRDLCSLDGLQKRREGLRQGVPQETSLLLMLLNADVARRFLREGVFLYGSHCRVSVYDPKKGSR
ncbi:hypothetical protein FB451DRAFT_1515423 [Mycena latifolia]|nr:hypothetical protein FB451DRAFT_1515423 [Mycena latifolia]